MSYRCFDCKTEEGVFHTICESCHEQLQAENVGLLRENRSLRKANLSFAPKDIKKTKQVKQLQAELKEHNRLWAEVHIQVERGKGMYAPCTNIFNKIGELAEQALKNK